jgi:hypothetical protein
MFFGIQVFKRMFWLGSFPDDLLTLFFGLLAAFPFVFIEDRVAHIVFLNSHFLC